MGRGGASVGLQACVTLLAYEHGRSTRSHLQLLQLEGKTCGGRDAHLRQRRVESVFCQVHQGPSAPTPIAPSPRGAGGAGLCLAFRSQPISFNSVQLSFRAEGSGTGWRNTGLRLQACPGPRNSAAPAPGRSAQQGRLYRSLMPYRHASQRHPCWRAAWGELRWRTSALRHLQPGNSSRTPPAWCNGRKRLRSASKACL